MNILLSSKDDVTKFFHKQGMFATNLLDMVGEGEKAYNWLLGDMTNGYDVTIGFFHEKARYAAFKKRAGDAWSEADTRACLMLIGAWGNWSSKPGSEYFDYSEKDGSNPPKEIANATGWQGHVRRYAFVYVPVVPGEIALAPVKTAIDQKFAGH